MPLLQSQEQQEIEQNVKNLLLETGLSYPENSLLEIASALGIKVLEADFGDPNINGIIKYKNEAVEDEPVIYLNKAFPVTRKTFTLAHELGHFRLHKGDEKYRLDRVNYSLEESKEETAANYFAAYLLVPTEKLREVCKEAEGDTEIIAKYFGVSRAVIENRLSWILNNQ